MASACDGTVHTVSGWGICFVMVANRLPHPGCQIIPIAHLPRYSAGTLGCRCGPLPSDRDRSAGSGGPMARRCGAVPPELLV